MTYFDAPYRPADLTLNSDAINSSLVGFWPLTDGSGTTAKDISGVGSNLTSPSTPLWGSSSIGPAYTSNGIDHQAYLNTNNGFPISSVDAFSVSFWYESDASGSYGDFLGDWSGGSEKNLLIRNNLECYVRNAGDTAEDGIQAVFPSGSPFNVAGAYHIVLVIDSGDAKLFLNGSLNNQDTSFMAGPYIAGNDNLKIGRGFNQSMQSGFLNNVRIFNAALTAAQVKQLYTRPWTGTNYDTEALWLSPPASPTLSSASEATSIMTSCLGWWPLTEGSGTVAKDIVGTNDGTITNVDWLDSELGMSSDFQTESNGDHITTNFSAAGQSEITVSFWMRNDGGATPNTYGRLLSMGFLNALDCYINKSSNNSLSFVVNSTNVYFSSLPPIGEWFHFCGVWSQSSHQELYINGSQVATGTADTSVIGSGSHNVIIGGTTSGPRTFHGGIQNVRIWDRALSSSEVALLAERPWIGAEYNESFYLYPPVPSSLTPLDSSSIHTDLQGWWPLTETDNFASGAADISGNGNNGTQFGGVLSEFGEIGTVANFDGSGDYIDTGSSSIVTSFPVTVSAWVKPTSGVRNTIFGSYYAVGTDRSLHCEISAAGKMFMLCSSTGSYQSTNSVTGTTTLSTSDYSHVVFVFEASGGSLYLNGVSESSSGSLFSTLSTPSVDFLIGTNGVTGNLANQFEGDIGNVRVWSRALSASEVADIYYSPWLGSAYTGTSSDPATNRFFSPAAFARLG